MARVPSPLTGSPVMQNNHRIYAAVRRRCRHGNVEIECPACIRNYPFEMGYSKRVEVSRRVTQSPIYTEWGRPEIDDIMLSDGERASVIVRDLLHQLQLETDDLLIDFHGDPTVKTVSIWRGRWGKQFWVRLPRVEGSDYEKSVEWVRLVAVAYPVVEDGRRGVWRKKQILDVYSAETSSTESELNLVSGTA